MDDKVEGQRGSSFFIPNVNLCMIEKKTVCQIVDEWLEGKDYFLVEVSISPDNKITVEIDHKEGVWIEDCVELSRYIESKLNRDDEDYELEVGSAGIGPAEGGRRTALYCHHPEKSERRRRQTSQMGRRRPGLRIR